ncbi:MAG: outer membrane protein OmpW [Lysobacterales bacterium]|jgi:outer membrane protein|nr:MAG: outer membrane protein OmpW [Xanthomonadales bacterium]
MRIHALSLSILTALAGASLATPAEAREGSFAVRAGFHNVDPKSNTGTIANGTIRTSIDSDAAFDLGFGYFFTDNLAVDLSIAGQRYKHTVSANGTDALDIRHRPVILTGQWHFGTEGFSPFIAAGYHWTSVGKERPFGPLANARVNVGNGDGFVIGGGFDVELNETLFARIDAHYLDWKSNVSVNGAGVGRVKVNPWMLGVSIGAKF